MLSGCPVCAKPLKRIASTPTHVPVEVVESRYEDLPPAARLLNCADMRTLTLPRCVIPSQASLNPLWSCWRSGVESDFDFCRSIDHCAPVRCHRSSVGADARAASRAVVLATEFRRRLMKGRATYARKEHLFSIFSRTAPSRNACEPGGHDPLEVRRQASPDPGSAIAYGTVVSPRISSTVRNCRWVHIRRRFEAAYEADAIISSLSLVQDFEPFSHTVVFSRLKMRHSRSS